MTIEQQLHELDSQGFCVLKNHLDNAALQACKAAFWPFLATYLAAHADKPNRGPSRHFIAMPFSAPCYASEFFFDQDVLAIVQGAMDDRIVADQWGPLFRAHVLSIPCRLSAASIC